MSFAVHGLDATVRKLAADGYHLHGEVAQYQDDYRLCYVEGPDGILVVEVAAAWARSQANIQWGLSTASPRSGTSRSTALRRYESS